MYTGKSISKKTPLNAWMSAVDSTRSLANMTILGTHDSCAFHADFGIGKCQHLSLTEQLNKGVRYLDIRCCVRKDAFQIYHGDIDENLNFDDVMISCRTFLSQNPSETIFMRIKQEHSHVSNEVFMGIFNGKYGKYQGAMFFVDKDNGPGTLAQARGCITVISNVATMPGIQWDDIIKQDNDSQDNEKQKWIDVSKMLDVAASGNKTSDTQYYLNGFNAHNAIDSSSSIRSMAVYIRDKFWDYLGPADKNHSYFGILATDYIDLYSEDNMKFILYNNN